MYMYIHMSEHLHTFVHVVVFPLPCKPTNMMILFFPFVGCHAGTPGSMSRHNSLNTADWIIRLLLRPAAISSKSMAFRTFSLSLPTSFTLTSASRRAVQISFSIAWRTWTYKRVCLSRA